MGSPFRSSIDSEIKSHERITLSERSCVVAVTYLRLETSWVSLRRQEKSDCKESCAGIRVKTLLMDQNVAEGRYTR